MGKKLKDLNNINLKSSTKYVKSNQLDKNKLVNEEIKVEKDNISITKTGIKVVTKPVSGNRVKHKFNVPNTKDKVLENLYNYCFNNKVLLKIFLYKETSKTPVRVDDVVCKLKKFNISKHTKKKNNIYMLSIPTSVDKTLDIHKINNKPIDKISIYPDTNIKFYIRNTDGVNVVVTAECLASVKLLLPVMLLGGSKTRG